MGAEQHVASLGDLKMREDIKQRQAKAKRDKRIQSGMQYLGQGLGIVAKVNGVRSASPSKQTSTLLSAVSMGLSAGGSMFGGRNHQAAAPAAQQPAGTSASLMDFQVSDVRDSVQQLLLQQ